MDREIARSRSRYRFRGKEIEDRRDTGNRENVPVKGVINTIAGGPGGGDSRRMRKRNERSVREDRHKELVMNVEIEEEITFSSKDLIGNGGSQDDPMIVKLDIANFVVHKVLIDNGSSTDIIFWNVLRQMGLEDSNLSPVQTPLVGFGGSEVASMGIIDLPVSMREEPKRRTGEAEEREKRKEREIEVEAKSKKFKSERMEPAEEYKSIELIVGKPDKTTRIGSNMSKSVETMMIELLRNNMDMFA
ncbi:UNVERIFIED_CONTAM: hypothetical protein Slati_1765000 [Sesamum latifolium]|uniref:Gag-pol polyprotein n=1 Tax=Sesamum latifolium TaxID=2727402 RepID=A0AAW2WZX8_9LAMI